MRLPKWLWRLIRSKRFHRFLLIAPFVAIVGVAVFYWGVNQWGQAKLDATREKMRELGIPTSLDELKEASPDGTRSLAEHPLLSAWLDSESGPPTLPVSQTLAGRKPDIYLYGSGAPDFVGDLRALFAAADDDATDGTVAALLLSEFQSDFIQLDRAFDAVEDPSYHLPFLLNRKEETALEILTRLAHTQTLRACLHAEAGNMEAMLHHLGVLFRLIERWQAYPTIFHYHVERDKFIDARLQVLPIILECAREHPAALGEIDKMLSSADHAQPLLRSLETDLGILFLDRASDLETATTLSWEQMDWRFEWRQDWSEWKKNLREWWWQVRPAGFTRTDIARFIDLHLEQVTRSPEGSLKNRLEWGDPRFREGFSNDISHSQFLFVYSLSGSLDAYFPTFLNLRFARLAIACERHHRETGSFPESAASLSPTWLPEPLVSPFTGEPIRLSVTPDGRLRFEGDGRDSAKPFRYEYPPEP